jgi:endo-1,4-beta-xylanase
MQNITRRQSLVLGAGLAVTACGGGGGSSSGGSGPVAVTPAPTPPPTPTPTPSPTPTPTATTQSLAAVAATRNMRFGSTFAFSAVGADAGSFANPSYAALLERDCSILVPENELKWQSIRPTATTFNFDQADAMLAYAESKRIAMRGHTLLWYVGERFPGWLNAYDFGASADAQRAEAERLVRTHVETVARRYGSRLTSWDVVNEAVDPQTGSSRTNVLANAVRGDLSLLDLAFRTARAELPTTQLVYNDYMDWGTPTHRAGVLALLRGFRDRGVPVDALGIQSHIGFYSNGTAQSIVDAQAAGWRSFLDQVTALGYDLVITEMDVTDHLRAATDNAVRDADIATLARGWLDLCMSYRQLKDVLFWGMSDRYSWLQGFQRRADGLPLRPNPYDTNFVAKPLRETVAEAFRATAVR